MPHIVVEYTDNIKQEVRVKELLKKINESLISEGDSFKPGAIRSRAVELSDYVVGDGTDDTDAFVHVTMKIAPGRSEEVKKAAFDHVFEKMEAHFEGLFANQYFALSLEIFEFGEGTYKQNDVYARIVK